MIRITSNFLFSSASFFIYSLQGALHTQSYKGYSPSVMFEIFNQFDEALLHDAFMYLREVSICSRSVCLPNMILTMSPPTPPPPSPTFFGGWVAEYDAHRLPVQTPLLCTDYNSGNKPDLTYYLMIKLQQTKRYK